MKINLAIIDDHALFRKGLIQLFNQHDDFNVLLECSDGADLIEIISTGNDIPDVYLLDIKMLKMNGIDCLKELNRIHPQNKTVMLSMYDDNPIVKKSLRIGARGYLLKNAEPEELFQTIKAVHTTGYFITPNISKQIIQNIQKPRQVDDLSAFNPLHLNAVELEVLGYICQGFTNAEIADTVHRSKRTIEGYRQKLLSKTSTKNTAALVAWAFRKGVVE